MTFHKIPIASKTTIAFLVVTTMVCPIFDVVATLLAQPQEKCVALLKEAEEKYTDGQLDETIALVNRCLDQDGLRLEESEQAYKLLGKTYHAKGLLAQSKENLHKLLELIPNWRPDPNLETPSFLRLVDEVIKEMKSTEEPKKEEPKVEPPVKKGGGKKFLFIGGVGAAAAAAVVFLLGSGGGAAQRLPEPPPLPQ